MKKISVMLAFGLMLGALAGCGSADTAKDTTKEKATTEITEATTEATTEAKKEEVKVDQLAKPKKGDTIATIKVKGFGEMKVCFFKDIAPKAVENFEKLSKKGYYDGLTFHRIIKDFMIQGGDPEGTGMGGESIWGTPFEDEFSDQLNVIRGALCMANSGENTNGSQFFIVQAKTAEDNTFAGTESQEMIDKYKANGGCPWLQGHHTVFGQVYEGLDVLDKIANVKADQQSGVPEEKVVVEKITISKVK